MKTTFLSPEEKRLYVEGLKEAAEIANAFSKDLNQISAAFACVVEVRDAILSRIKELEKESGIP